MPRTCPAQQRTDGIEQRRKRGVRGNVEARTDQHREVPTGGQSRGVLRHGRLADAGIPADHKHLWLALHRLAQGLADERKLVVAPDQQLRWGLARHPITLFAPSTRPRTEQVLAHARRSSSGRHRNAAGAHEGERNARLAKGG